MRNAPIPCLRLAGAAGLAGLLLLAAHDGDERVLDAKVHHLGNDNLPEWTETTAAPEGKQLELEFESPANPKEWVLFATHRDVDHDWTVAINGNKVALLKKGQAPRTVAYPVPEGAIRDGRNRLTITGSNPDDDMAVGNLRLLEKSLREHYQLGRVDVVVTDAADGTRLPARLTVVDDKQQLANLFYAESPSTAVRSGLAYTGDGGAALEVPAGRYTVFATRGIEWSVAKGEVEVQFGKAAWLALSLSREVDTTGWIAADTHIHTLTFSGHGDASVEERLVTIAGEGIELPIATDHNHHTDYRPLQKQMQLTKWFTPVVGDEVTTDNGHMNAFPFDPAGEIPPFKETDWGRLVTGIRGKGAKVVILNHPRWPENGRDPLTSFAFDDFTGERANAMAFTFDGYEVVNSDSAGTPPDIVLPGWMALMNRGERFTAVGASDSHAVGVIVGQGRTYVPSATDDPARIDVDAACRAFKEGRVSVSLGLFAEIEVDGKYGMGDIAAEKDRSVEVALRVKHPSWITPTKVELWLDGSVVATAPLTRQQTDSATVAERSFTLHLPPHDGALVAIAWGEAVKEPYWTTEISYTLAVTNPVFLDVDGDGKWSSPRAIAQALLAKSGTSEEKLAQALADVDDGVGLQLLSLARDAWKAQDAARLESLANGSGDRTRLKDYVATQKTVK